MKLTTMLESRIRESYQIQLFTTCCNQKLTESYMDHFDSQKFQFHVLIVLLGAVCALCFNMRFFLGSFGWKKIADYVTIAQAALLIKLLHGIFKIANMAKILYENIKRKFTIVSYLFLALTIPNLVVLYHTLRPKHRD